MPISKFPPVLLGTLFFISTFSAAEPDPAANPNEAVVQQLAAMQKTLQDLQTRQQAEIDSLKQQVADQQKVIENLKQAGPAAANPATAGPIIPTSDPSVVADLPGGGAPATPAGGMFPTTDPSVVADAPPSGAAFGPAPATGNAGVASPKGSYLNVSFDAVVVGAASTADDLSALEVGDHDPQQNGFNARNFELALDGAVDPYFEGFANIVFKLDNHNETEVEAEEAFGQTTSLPFGLQVKAGQFFSPFGRINATHPHTWDFVDAPLVQGRILGPDGLRGVGAQLAWVAPTPFYAQALLSVQNGMGGTGYSFRNPGEDGTFFGRETIDRQTSGLSDMVFVPRLEASFDPTPSQTILAGASAAFGPNDTGADSRTQIYGLDFFYKWKPANAEGGWPFVKWQNEVMARHYEAGRGEDNSFPTAESFHDWGAYSQLVWGFHKGWCAGLRGDYLHMDDSDLTEDDTRQSRWRLSTDVTWYPSEFSKLRLQYNHDVLDDGNALPGGDEDSLFLMYEISLGAHGAHKF